jgi:hypothetical protein
MYLVVGYTSAIAMPSSIYNFAKENAANFPVLFIWDLRIVKLLGIGIVTAVFTYLI